MSVKPKNQDLWKNLNKIGFIRRFFNRAALKNLPFSGGLELRSVLKLFIRGLDNGFLGVRAGAISFHFFLAMFPAIITIFTVIPYIKIADFQELLLNIINTFIPDDSWEMVRHTIEDIILRPRAGLLSLSSLLTLVFTSSGISMMIAAFNNTYHYIEYRPWIRRRGLSIVLAIVITSLLIVMLTLLTFGNIALNFLVDQDIIRSENSILLYQIVRFFLIVLLLFIAISILYYFAPAKRKKFSFISHGALITILLSGITTVLFNFYIHNFGQYNYLYGSLGALIIFLVWIYLNAVILLIGFEFNAAVVQARDDKKINTQVI
ncbi:MAG: YihY/virulence factor BrkB family protein [Bacteroidales bacterium]|nr:YihY/virulence factor BrkB family protein [Bacteroidales bacterium]MDD2322442.1 YihY/virulence factor BrkB family protein [Bacteroidales bacterium]MDD3010819.1 YihY/virulence factor BrkB family protein [Bacteroidales bacterium]MDD3961646.1 YihY/virulence factor BrkB family protein [Bacteroidales bacterium]HPE87015.1 YihY/virulence factor BrkB family protein [Bacteroidales bacterium]